MATARAIWPSLNFEPAPPLKAIARHKLCPDAELRGVLGNLVPILSKEID